ncbi:MAG: hypothetical protein OEZ31_00950 [Nitrospirota bacterium]|nr:hypothetical protein [Nitrospirota bacterium]MDH5767513.1 hypothetical protein [Nitrospirota bacterium]
MKEERILNEKIKLLEKELTILTEKVEKTGALKKEVEDLKSQIDGLKLFLVRAYPEFKSQFPEIMKKIFNK